jgi:O-methyltransferase involved in polyketide biosynthesis
MDERNFHSISPTAKLIAFMRAMSDIPYSREIADMCDAEATAKTYSSGNREAILKRAPLAELRFKSLSGILPHVGIDQVLELASGLSPRGLIMTENPEITFVETDLSEMLTEKQEIVSELLGTNQRPNYLFAPANALQPAELRSAAAHFKAAPVAVIHEGLMPYLNNDEKRQLAESIAGVLDHFSGTWITPDILIKEHHEKRMASSPAQKHIATTTGRNMNENLFEDFQDAQKFFEDVGFRIERHRQIDFTPSIHCAVSDPEIAEEIQKQEIWVMRLTDR